MLWIDFAQVLQDPAAVAAATSVLLLPGLNAAVLALRPFTIVRTRGLVLVTSDQAGATEHQMGAFGFGLAQDQAVASGIGSLPTPVTEAGSSNWFLWQPLLSTVSQASAAAFANIGNVYEFDSKAQRKVPVGEDVYVAVENESATDGFLVSFVARMLVKIN